MWKICHGEPQNLANWLAEFGEICCGKMWSLNIGISTEVLASKRSLKRNNPRCRLANGWNLPGSRSSMTQQNEISRRCGTTSTCQQHFLPWFSHTALYSMFTRHNKAFSFAGPAVWSVLPAKLRSIKPKDTFKWRLKALYFRLAF